MADKDGIERGTGMGVPGGARAVRPKETLASPLRPDEAALFQKLLGKAPAGEAPPKRPKPVALIVDDDPMARRYMALILQKLEVSTLEAGDGEQALAMILKERPELVLLDIRLPLLDGYQVLRGLRNYLNFKRTVVVAMTGLTSADDEISLLSLGADDVIPKPFSRSKATAKLQAVVRRIRDVQA